MTNQELFEEFRKAETDEQRSDVFHILYCRRSDGELSLDEIPADLESPLCMLYDDFMFRKVYDYEYFGLDDGFGYIDFYGEDYPEFDENEPYGEEEQICPKSDEYEHEANAFIEFYERYSGMFSWQDAVYKSKHLILSANDVISYSGIHNAHDYIRFVKLPLDSIERVKHIKHDGIHYVFVYPEREDPVYIRLDRGSAEELISRIGELKQFDESAAQNGPKEENGK